MLKRLGIAVMVFLLITGCSLQEADSTDGRNPGTSPAASAKQSDPPVQPSPAATLDPASLNASFGFADLTGKRILAASEDDSKLAEMKSLNMAVGQGGQLLTVRFEKWQRGTANSDGRDLANNFANLSGYVFTVEEGSAASDETYYLADSAVFAPGSLLKVEPAGGKPQQLGADHPVRKEILARKQRKIQSIWKLADLSASSDPSGELHLYLVQFARQDKNMLFSLVLQKNAELSFADYPAVIQEDDYSVWRVDDGGEILPEMFSLLFAARTATGVALGINWWGAEGVNSFFLLQQGIDLKEMDVRYSRYTSPL
ncbi:hypothetical protein A3842_03790 [Paenibacillus sp. P3E]|uniref:hypothetical protein n=1 Tax=Paenibacillus sp. P3E TaxID=1349435 RepID=UPI00093F25B4|nr:hypothetical protein [Paenibacillus sp. P3E]OKP90248.1 hypothetical protein A3842_03790 [Paenibacillus sp. P3E]